MERGFVKAMCATVLCFLILGGARAQSYQYLTLNDFQGTPQRKSDAVAYTQCYIDLKYDATKKNGYYELSFYVTLTMNRDKSWIDRTRVSTRSALDEVLKHEQGHYTIAYFEQLELLREFSRTRFGADYKETVKEIFDRIHAKYEQLTLDYDEDTHHSLNDAQQASWDKYFQKRLNYMPPIASRE